LSNVDNTSDLLKPLSTATINALNAKATATEVTSSLLLKENISNKSSSILLGTSNDLYPTQNAVKAYVDAQINSGGVADNGITTVKIMDANVTNAKLADNSVSTTKIIDGTIVSADISNSAAIPFSKLNITKSDINGLGIPSNTDLTTYSAGNGLTLAGSVFSIGAGAITTTTIADGAISTAKLADASINTAKLADNSVSTSKIIDGTIVSADISNTAAIPFSKLNITKSDINGLGIPSNTDLSTYSAGNGLTLTGSVFSIGAGAITTTTIADGAISTAKLADNSVSTAKIIDGTIVSADISNTAAIPFSKLSISKSDINGLGIPSNTDLTIYSAGNGLTLTGSVFSIGAGAITTTTIADGAISTAKIADASVTSSKISGVLSVSNGGTGLATLTSNSVLVGNGTSTVNFVAPGASGNVLKSDGTSWVSGTVSSSSSFSSDLSIQGSTFGLGGGNKSNSVAIGNYALHSNSSGVYNTAVGAFALATNTSGNDNTAIGNTSLYGLTTGYQNIAIGSGAMQSVTSGYNNTSVGYLSDIGTFANGGIYNSTAIGYNAVANSNNTIQLGNNQISSVNTAGKITTGAITFPNTDGTNGQVLSTNGSGSIGWTNMSTSGTINVGYVPYGYTSPSLAGNFTYDATSKLNYIRIGNMVLFNGYIGKFSQNAGTRSTVNFALPIASNFINKTDAIGTVSADNSTSTGVTGAVYASPSDDNLIVSFITTNTTATDIFISFSGSYIIK
jgi:hypothetical protein